MSDTRMNGLRPYPEYKDSGTSWLGKVPESWEIRRIKTLFQESEDRKEQRPMELLSLTRSRGLIPQSENSSPTLLAEDLSRYKVCRPTDVVMNRMQAWSGMFAVPPHEGVVSPDYSVFTPTTCCELGFFEHLFKIPILVEQFAKASKGIGTGFNRLYSEDFGSITVGVPPLDQQNAIVRYLDDADQRIRAYVSAKERLIALLEEMKQAVIHQAVTRGLDPNVKLKPSGVEWLGDVPEHWDVDRLKTHVANINDSTRERKGNEPYITLEHVESWTGKIHDAGDEISFDSQVKRFQAGDVLFGKLRPYLAKVTAPNKGGVCVGEFLVLRTNQSKMASDYLELLMRSKPVIDTINASTFGAKMPRADWDFIGSLEQPIPPISEQVTILEHLDRVTSHIDAATNRARRQVELMGEYRTKLIADVVTGKINVRRI